jgi:regulatory protein
MSKWINREDALKKMMRYCAYQDRCHQEVRKKLIDLQVYPDWREEIIVELIQENFLNEERYARSFARGKFRIKKWGRRRILKELKQRQISDYCIRKAMQEIEEEPYLQTIESLILKKADQLKETDLFKKKNKVANYLIGRGFETNLIWPLLHKLLAE